MTRKPHELSNNMVDTTWDLYVYNTSPTTWAILEGAILGFYCNLFLLDLSKQPTNTNIPTWRNNCTLIIAHTQRTQNLESFQLLIFHIEMTHNAHWHDRFIGITPTCNGLCGWVHSFLMDFEDLRTRSKTKSKMVSI